MAEVEWTHKLCDYWRSALKSPSFDIFDSNQGKLSIPYLDILDRLTQTPQQGKLSIPQNKLYKWIIKSQVKKVDKPSNLIILKKPSTNA